MAAELQAPSCLLSAHQVQSQPHLLEATIMTREGQLESLAPPFPVIYEYCTEYLGTWRVNIGLVLYYVINLELSSCELAQSFQPSFSHNPKT